MIKFCFTCGRPLIEGKEQVSRYDENSGKPIHSIRLTCKKVLDSQFKDSSPYSLGKLNGYTGKQAHTDRWVELSVEEQK